MLLGVEAAVSIWAAFIYSGPFWGAKLGEGAEEQQQQQQEQQQSRGNAAKVAGRILAVARLIEAGQVGEVST